ncbi:MAG: hypothetical protein Q9192_004452 [Flavoplaca navasiana]
MLPQLDYAGSPEEAQPYFENFNDSHSVAVRKWESLSPTEIQPAAGQNIGSGIWSTTFSKQIITEHPEFPDFNRSVGKFESYVQQGAKAVDLDSTAHANRDDDILVYETTCSVFLSSWSKFQLRFYSSLSPVYPPSAINDAIATEHGNKARAIWHAGDTPGRNVTAYLDCVNGDEALEVMDGYQSWRLERLRALKKQYDPGNRFWFYDPIQ